MGNRDMTEAPGVRCQVRLGLLGLYYSSRGLVRLDVLYGLSLSRLLFVIS